MSSKDLKIKAKLTYKNKVASLRSEYLKKVRSELDAMDLSVPFITIVQAYLNKKTLGLDDVPTKQIKTQGETDTEEMTSNCKENTVAVSTMISAQSVFSSSETETEKTVKPVVKKEKRRKSLFGLVDDSSTESAQPRNVNLIFNDIKEQDKNCTVIDDSISFLNKK